MTDKCRREIVKLREAGMGYGRISRLLDIPLSTVKSYCIRKKCSKRRQRMCMYGVWQSFGAGEWQEEKEVLFGQLSHKVVESSHTSNAGQCCMCPLWQGVSRQERQQVLLS